jgi:predicted lipoprotein with Yx(FWY)xxD motif
MKQRVPMPRLARPGALASILLIVAAWAAAPVLAVDYATPSPMATATPSAPASLQIGAGSSAALGSFLVGPNGMTLYTLSSETSTGSVCTGGCLTNWPPLLVTPGGSVTGPAAATGAFSTITRADDGSTQAAYNGRPLYYFAHDTAIGQTNGEGIKAFGGVWLVAAAVRAVAAGSPPATASPTPASTLPPTSTGGAGTGDGPGGILPLLLLLLGVGATTMVAVGALPRRRLRRD